jgi:hypothetical protein
LTSDPASRPSSEPAEGHSGARPSRPTSGARERVVGALLLVAFAAYRWVMRVEPLNSDDVTLFGIGTYAVEGAHWLFEGQPPPALHQHLRLGFLPLVTPFIALFGPNQLAFYTAPIAVAAVGFWLCWRSC